MYTANSAAYREETQPRAKTGGLLAPSLFALQRDLGAVSLRSAVLRNAGLLKPGTWRRRPASYFVGLCGQRYLALGCVTTALGTGRVTPYL